MSDTVCILQARSYAMIASICVLVRTAPKCGMRPDEMPRMPYCVVGRHADADPAEQLARRVGGGNWLFTSPPVRFGP